MAAHGCSCVVFSSTCENAFYFNDEGTDTDVVDDAFNRSRCLESLIQSKDNKFLLLNKEQFQACDIPIHQQADCKFFVQMYNATLDERGERAAVLYTKKKDKKVVVCCKENNEVYPEALDPPVLISESGHKAVFYVKQLSGSNTYTFESSVYVGKFLGFEPDKNNPCLKKLVLQPWSRDEVDDNVQIMLRSFKK